MKNVSLVILLFILSSCAKDWSYKSKTGPEKWADLKEEYKFCKIGYNQSPINLTFPAKENSKEYKLKYSYSPSEVEKKWQFKNLKFSFYSKDFLTFRGREYRLQSIFFHHPSEHLINGKQESLEMHIFHKSDSEQSLALALMISLGEENAQFANIISLLENKKRSAVADLDLSRIIDKKGKFFFYDGSLTTPPCTEGVKWFIMKDPIQISKEQMNKIIKLALKGRANARPAQKFSPEKY